MNIETSSLSFSVTSNVTLKVIDEKNNKKIKEVRIHNKANRNMVIGIFRFLMGHFNYTNENSETVQYPDEAKDYIPCFIGFGCGGIESDETGPITVDGNIRIPSVDQNWNSHVEYDEERLVREFNGYGSRPKIASITSSITNPVPTIDMDSIFIKCKLGPDQLSQSFGWSSTSNVFVSEVGLFPTSIVDDPGILAHVKLSDDDILFVRPQDTVSITWNISIVAIGRDSSFKSSENGDLSIAIPQVSGGAVVIPLNES